jgi:peptidoglycan/LPS O-acetylase OafA/YrhL
MHLPARTAPHDVFIAEYLRTIYYPSWARLDGLAAGAALAWIGVFHAETWRRYVASRNWFWCLVGLGGIGLSILLFTDRFGFWATVIGFPMLAFGFAALVAGLASPAFRLPSPMQRVITAVALMSYSLYLVHKPVFHLVAEKAGAWCDSHHVPLIVPAWTAAILVGGAAYLAVERPFLQLRSALARTRREKIGLAVSAP